MRVATSACAGSSAMRNIRTISTGWAELEVGSMFGAHLHSRLHQPRGLQRMGDDGLHVDEAGAWVRRLGRVTYRVARSARRFRRGGDDRGGFAPSDRDGARMSGQAPE